MEVFIGLLIGSLLGLTGAGGSVFAVPLLLVLTSISTNEAMGLALGAVAISAVYGSVQQRRRILWTPALILAVSGAAVAPLGRWLAFYIPELLLLLGFSLLASMIALRMWMQANNQPVEAGVRRADMSEDVELPNTLLCRLSPTGQFQLKPRCLSGLAAGGVLVGFVSGIFGVGGGFLIVPLLLALSQLDIRIAVASSLFVISLISSAGFLTQVLMGPGLPFTPLALLMGASLVGMLLSQFLAKYLPAASLQKIFAISLLSISLFSLMERLL